MKCRGFVDFGVIASRFRVSVFFRRVSCFVDDDVGRFWMDFAESGRAPGFPAVLPALT